MCGILGMTGTSLPKQSDIKIAMDLIINRGPDHQDTLHVNDQAFFGHARLSIIDLSAAGHQPYQFEHLTLAFNGMIYNHKTLREELRNKGYDFLSSSDTEVLIKAWHCWGQDALLKLDGFFAFALYDQKTDSLHLCRDPLGKKPLYWRHWNNGIAFASRLDAVEALTRQESFNQEAVPWLFYLKYIPAPMTAVQHVFKLEAGHHLTHSSSGTQISRWAKTYGLNSDAEKPTNQTPEALKQAIINAVEKRLEADVPVSTLLSGGLDSTIVTTLASRFVQLDSFTLAIKSEGNNLQFDESAIAYKTAKALKTNHHSITMSEDDALRSMDGLFSQVFDEPFADPASVLNHLIFSQLSQQSKVCLTGDGADELFGGYRRHQGHLLAQHPIANNPVIRLFAKSIGPYLPDRRDNPTFEKMRLVRRYFMALNNANDDGRSWLCREDVTQEWFSIETNHEREFFAWSNHPNSAEDMDSINRLLSLEMQWTIPGQMMVKTDRTSMDVGVEVRSPFLDQHVIETAFSLDGRQKLQRNNGKAILRSLFREDIPRHVFDERKRGFEMPLKTWLQGPFSHYLERVSHPEFLAKIGLKQHVVQGWINSLNHNHATTAADHLWTLISLRMWIDAR